MGGLKRRMSYTRRGEDPVSWAQCKACLGPVLCLGPDTATAGGKLDDIHKQRRCTTSRADEKESRERRARHFFVAPLLPWGRSGLHSKGSPAPCENDARPPGDRSRAFPSADRRVIRLFAGDRS